MEKTMRWIPILVLALGCGGDKEDCDAWYCEDGTASGDDDDGKGTTTGKGGTDKGDDDDKGSEFATLSGSPDASTGLGWLYLDGTGCTSDMEVTEATPGDSCTDCDVAFYVTPTALAPGNTDCDDTIYYLDQPIGVGHSDAEGLWFEKGSWEPVDGTSSIVGDAWDFTFGDK